MVVHTGTYDSGSQTESRFNNMQLVVYYSNSADTTPPDITDPDPLLFHSLSGLTASFQVTAADASGIYRVLIIYDDTRTNSWKNLDLAYNSGSGKWEGSLLLKGNIEYLVQAVDNNGNVGTLLETAEDLSGIGAEYGSEWTAPMTYLIALPDADGDSLRTPTKISMPA